MPQVKRKKATPYSRGELNRLIDSLLHPLFRSDKGFVIADTVLHGFVEKDPPTTVMKFIKYNLPKIIEEIEKGARADRKTKGSATGSSSKRGARIV